MIVKVKGNIVDAEPVSFGVEHTVLEVQNPEKRKSDKSTDLRLIGTDRTLRALEFQENINSPSKQDFDCEVRSGITSLFGKLKINKIKRNNQRYEFDCVVVASNYNWVQAIKGKSCNILSWDVSRLEHTYNAVNIINSESLTWATDYDYRYPLIDYGYFTDGELRNEVNVIDRFPAINLRALFIAIFNQAGYEVSSDFISTELFQQLYLPFNNSVIIRQDTEFNNLDVNFALNDVYVQSIDPDRTTVIKMFDSNTEEEQIVPFDQVNSDESESFNVTTYKYKFKRDIAADVRFNGYIEMNFFIDDPVTDTATVKVEIVSNIKGTIVFQERTELVDGTRYEYNINTDYLEFSEDEEVWVNVSVTGSVYQDEGLPKDLVYTMYGEISGVDEAAEMLINTTNRRGRDYEWSVSEILPDVDQLELVQSVIRLFNLLVITNQNLKTVYIEPRCDFFTGERIDYTDTVLRYSDTHISKKISKVYSWEYKKDNNDKLAEIRNKDLEYPLLSYQYNTENFNREGVTSYINPLFSETHYVNSSRIGITEYLLPALWNFSQLENIQEPNFNFNLRILYYNGVGTLLNTYVFSGNTRSSIPIFSNIDLNRYQMHKDTARTLDQLYYITVKVKMSSNQVNNYLNTFEDKDIRSVVSLEAPNCQGLYVIYSLKWDEKTEIATLTLEKYIENRVNYDVKPLIL